MATGDTDVFGTSDLSVEVHNVTNGETCQNSWPEEFPFDAEEASGGLLESVQQSRLSSQFAFQDCNLPELLD